MQFTTVAETYEKDSAIIRSKWQAVCLGVLLAGLLALPFFAGDHIVNFVTLTAITLIAVHGVNIVLGYCGDITVAQAAFVLAYAPYYLTYYNPLLGGPPAARRPSPGTRG